MLDFSKILHFKNYPSVNENTGYKLGEYIYK